MNSTHCEVIPVGDEHPLGLGACLAFIDRHLEGMGIADPLTAEALAALVRGANLLLSECDGSRGMPPPHHRAAPGPRGRRAGDAEARAGGHG
ncbi:MAG: hypothetical protein JXX28_09600 [Deltaproteobacteria bacterium]|nr:hypothetical protein [Deltaproteobacteria bacterium]